ncbi:hypothetical protein BCR42DRAFT_414515 [Absidia repens]|uniref:Uncharacterized protein n=1 Tax=Absidia repens TaxID=90262 RepID=A0A1X2IJ80_9FUNG|nr:hypothetical protein BCR42DRAFT_414515 [Absidia repens]
MPSSSPHIYFCPPRLGMLLMTLFWAFRALADLYVAGFSFHYTRGIGWRQFNIQLKNCSLLKNPINSFDDAIYLAMFCLYLFMSYSIWKQKFIYIDITLYIMMAIIIYKGWFAVYLLVQILHHVICGWVRSGIFSSLVLEFIFSAPSIINRIYFVWKVKSYLSSLE